MADIRVSVAGLALENPVLPAAGPPGRNGEEMRACVEGGAAAAVSKTLSVAAAEVPTPHMAEVRGGFLNAEAWSEIGPERFVAEELPRAKASGVPLIVSVGYTAQEIAMVAPMVVPWADALELSTHYVGDDPGPMVAAIKAAKEAVGVPVLVKLSPFRDITLAAQAAADAGADGIVAVNSFGPCMAVDIETGYPVMGSGTGYGWLSGPALRPLAVRCVYDAARATELPVIGVGGITRGEDAVEMVMAGATAVGICTAAILEGAQVYGRIAREVAGWLDEHGYGSLAEIRGLAHHRMARRSFRTAAIPPMFDEQACIGCGRCEESCVYHAIHVADGKAVLARDLCRGCGLCVSRCPTRALQTRR
jgi:dihydroorotate dehydrogenase subfamily 1